MNKDNDRQNFYYWCNGGHTWVFLWLFLGLRLVAYDAIGTITDIRSGVGVDMAQRNTAIIASALYPELLSSNRITFLTVRPTPC